MTVAMIFAWILILLLVVAVLALSRQLGVLHERIAPIGALALAQGPQPGQAAPPFSVAALDGSVVKIGGVRLPARLQILLFVSPDCPICRTLLPTALSFSSEEDIDLLLIGDGDLAEHRAMSSRYQIPLAHWVLSTAIGRAYQVAKLPYAVLVGSTGLVVSQGLVNSREHLESLIVSHETGLRSVQEYLEIKRAAAHV